VLATLACAVAVAVETNRKALGIERGRTILLTGRDATALIGVGLLLAEAQSLMKLLGKRQGAVIGRGE